MGRNLQLFSEYCRIILPDPNAVLTELGYTLSPILEELSKWGHIYFLKNDVADSSAFR